MIVQRFNLNLIPNQSPVIVHVNQYDTGTGRLIATLYEGNEPYSPNGTAVIQGTKPDGHGFQYTATLDGNVVTADLTEQMAPVAGDVRTQIVVTESSGVTGTFVFIMRVQPSALPSDTDMSESDYPIIEEAIREAREAMTESAESAETAEAWAQGTRGGIPVEPTDPTYEHNAEYWAQYAERYAQGGLHYKASIPFVDIPTTGMREGDMYDITDDFTTDSRFTEGAGIKVKGGTNIAWNSDNKWDILALPYIPKTTFNGRSGSILPMAGDYDSKKILLTSALHIGGETQNDVQEALEALSNDGVKSFNGRSGSILPMAGDYDSEKILLASVLHIGGETQENVQEALEALENNKADKVEGAIADNFAGLDADGNLKDSGKKASDFATPSDIAGQQSLLKDTVGWTGKNLLKNTATTQTINGVTFTVNADGSVTTNGAPTTTSTRLLINQFMLSAGSYIATGCPNGGTLSTYSIAYRKDSPSGEIIGSDIGSGLSFTLTEDTIVNVRLVLIDGNIDGLIWKPMLRRASITDPTYEPYHESVEVMYEEEIHGVNLLKVTASTQTISGVTFTVNSDGSIKANGTATSDIIIPIGVFNYVSESVILTGCPSGGAWNTYRIDIRNADNTQYENYLDTGNGVTFVPNRNYTKVCIRIGNGTTVSNLTFYPMLRKAEIDDPTYRPYNNQAIQNQLNAQGVLGAKNLVQYPYNNNSKTVSGVTFTVNSDGTIVVNGTATTDVYFNLIDTGIKSVLTPLKPNTKYIISGCEGGNNLTYRLWHPLRKSGGGYDGYSQMSEPIEYITPSDLSTYAVTIVIASGATVNNVKFKPMIRLASDPDDTYQPYAMTNRELTEEKINIADLKTVVSASSDFADFKTRIASL